MIAVIMNGLVPFEMNPMLGPDSTVLIDFGAKSTPRILNGQFYRLITPIFMHGTIFSNVFLPLNY